MDSKKMPAEQSKAIKPQKVVEPKTPSRLPRLTLAIIIFVVLVAVYFILSARGQQNTSYNPPSITPTPRLKFDNGGVDANWETYLNDKYLFKIKYPQDMTLGSEPNAPGPELYSSRSIFTSDPTAKGVINIEVVSTPIEVVLDSLERLGNTESNIEQINGINYYRVDWVEKDRPIEPSEQYTLKYFTSRNNFTYIISAYIDNNSPEKENFINTFNQILSTFQFLDQNDDGISSKTITSIPILPIDGWRAVSQNGISFMIPPEGICLEKDSYTEVGDNCSLIYDNPSDKTAITIRVEDYNGGSRREQFLRNASYTDCNFIFQEGLFGDVKALQIAAGAGLCQGNAGAIAAVIGDKLVIIQNLFYNPNTNTIEREAIQDTIISTLKAN